MSKEATVGWLGLGLIVANVVSGPLRPVLSILTGGDTPTTTGKGKSKGLGWSFIPGVPIPLPPGVHLPGTISSPIPGVTIPGISLPNPGGLNPLAPHQGIPA